MNVGLVGYGYWGKNVARAIARVANLAYIVEPNAGRLTEAASTWTPWGTVVTTDLDKALDRCDAMWVATPADTHYDVVENALDAGCHVLCEKPFVMRVGDAEQLVAKAENRDLALMVGHLSLYTGEHQQMRPPHPKPRRIETVRWNTEASISDHSVLWGLGPHDVATIVDLLGSPERVECKGTRHRVSAELSWPDAHATIELDWLSTQRHRVLKVDGVFPLNNSTSEPLLVEAEYFMRLCRSWKDREPKIVEAVVVTRTLARMQESMEALDGPVVVWPGE